MTPDILTLCMLWFSYGYEPPPEELVYLPGSGVYAHLLEDDMDRRNEVCIVWSFDAALEEAINSGVNELAIYTGEPG